MRTLAAALGEGRWGLARAREEAQRLEGSPPRVRQLVTALFADDAELRKRAADVARRVTDRDAAPPQLTDRDAAPLRPHADELLGALAATDQAESRTRWHLGLVVARVAHTHEQRLRAARLLELLAEDASNVVRCSAIEGMAVLATTETSLRAVAAELVEQALRSGSKAEQCRAREARKRLLRARAWAGEDGV